MAVFLFILNYPGLSHLMKDAIKRTEAKTRKIWGEGPVKVEIFSAFVKKYISLVEYLNVELKNENCNKKIFRKENLRWA